MPFVASKLSQSFNDNEWWTAVEVIGKRADAEWFNVLML